MSACSRHSGSSLLVIASALLALNSCFDGPPDEVEVRITSQGVPSMFALKIDGEFRSGLGKTVSWDAYRKPPIPVEVVWGMSSRE